LKIEGSHRVFLGLGSNLGDKEGNIRSAIARINEQIGTVVRQSAFYYSEPWGFESDNQFVNAVICVHTGLTPHQLLKATQRIERQLGKTAAHATERPHSAAVASSTLYKDRPIDIDILLYDDLHIDEPNLKIPHPLMNERPFVTIPLTEILS
jgi:2-amino-4-hydroxy-6-hydroxymethyldihydropteridine diphosphokinase